MNEIIVRVQMDENAKLPVYAHKGDSGMDVYTNEDITLEPGETKLVPTGLYFNIPQGYEIQVRPRSGISLKSSLRVANSPGTIDSNYTGELKIIVHNLANFKGDKNEFLQEDGNAKIPAGTRIAQIVLQKVEEITWEVVEKIDDNEDRGAKGMGSSGVK